MVYNKIYKREYYISDPYDNAVQFSLTRVLPIMLGLKISNQTRYTSFIQGEDSSPLHEVFKNNTLVTRLCSSLLSRNETYWETQNEQQVHVLLKPRFSRF